MLSERERQALTRIEDALTSADPKFVDGIRMGRPRRPREYRQSWLVLLVLLGVAAFTTVLATGSPLAVLAMILVSVGGLVRYVSRQLDRA